MVGTGLPLDVGWYLRRMQPCERTLYRYTNLWKKNDILTHHNGLFEPLETNCINRHDEHVTLGTRDVLKRIEKHTTPASCLSTD